VEVEEEVGEYSTTSSAQVGTEVAEVIQVLVELASVGLLLDGLGLGHSPEGEDDDDPSGVPFFFALTNLLERFEPRL